jgi:N-acetylglucosamine kinase-like BadF-type ATPase
MILIADAGSSKTSWILVNNERMIIGKFESGGLNPTVFDEDTLSKNIARNAELMNHAPYIREIYLYGSGVSEKNTQEKLNKILSELFDKAEIHIFTDMIAAVRATAGNAPGIVSILSTGSNSCYFDGNDIVETVGYMGYLLMDDASGNWFGKQLLRDYYFKKMPKQLRQQFKNEYKIDTKKVLEHLYNKPQPNVFLAGFAPFMQDHYKSPYIKALLTRGFEQFVTQELSTYDHYKDLPLHFVGPIAFFFQKELIEVIEKEGLKLGKIIRNPIEELIDFHV